MILQPRGTGIRCIELRCSLMSVGRLLRHPFWGSRLFNKCYKPNTDQYAPDAGYVVVSYLTEYLETDMSCSHFPLTIVFKVDSLNRTHNIIISQLL